MAVRQSTPLGGRSARIQPDDLADGEIGLEACRLKLDAHPGFRCGGICSSVDIADSDRPGVGPQQTLDGAEGAGLSGSVRAKEAKDLPRSNVEGHAVNGPLRTIADVEVFDSKSQTGRCRLAGSCHSGSHIMGDTPWLRNG
jgi:hypothetical protein